MDSISLIVVGLVAGAAIAAVILKLSKKQSAGDFKNNFSEIENLFHKVSQDVLRNTSEQFSRQFQELAKERLERTAEKVNSDLESKKNTISGLIEEIRKDIGKNQDYLKKSDNERIANFAALAKELETYKQITGELRNSTEDLKRLLSNNQLRGRFGEQVAENLLKMSGFVINVDYIFNKEQENVDTRPDFTIFLPDKTKINVDAKFPYSALVKYTECDNKEEKAQYLRNFEADVRQKIKQVTTRDYINPEARTVDFVILFIPNEMIFSFIYDKFSDTWEEAMGKKVIMAGPFSFTAILRMVKQSYSNFRYQENLHHIIGLIQKFDLEYQKYGQEVDRLGERLSSASKQFDKVSTTRARALTRIVDQIKAEEVPAAPNLDEDAENEKQLKLD